MGEGTGRAGGDRSAINEERDDLLAGDFIPAVTFDQHFAVAHPAEAVFALFGRLDEVAACLPGASLTAIPAPDRAEGQIRVKLGPIAAAFRGVARIERSPEMLSGRIVGSGRDARSRSLTRGEVRYRLTPIESGAATRADITVGYTLSGALAQFGRPGLVKDLAGRLTAEFARNLEARLSGAPPAPAPPALNVAALLFALLRDRVRALFSTWRSYRSR
jgi:aerobic carbon-monoxide dehydrogenase small subunit